MFLMSEGMMCRLDTAKCFFSFCNQTLFLDPLPRRGCWWENWIIHQLKVTARLRKSLSLLCWGCEGTLGSNCETWWNQHILNILGVELVSRWYLLGIADRARRKKKMEQEEKMSKSRVGESWWGGGVGCGGYGGGQLVVGHLPPTTHA